MINNDYVRLNIVFIATSGFHIFLRIIKFIDGLSQLKKERFMNRLPPSNLPPAHSFKEINLFTRLT